jgi:hypothetical protein
VSSTGGAYRRSLLLLPRESGTLSGQHRYCPNSRFGRKAATTDRTGLARQRRRRPRWAGRSKERPPGVASGGFFVGRPFSRGRGRLDAPTRKIAPVLALIALILFAVAVITVAAVVLLRSRQTTELRGARYPDEREVYENIYGRPSETVYPPPSPVEPPPKADADRPGAPTPSAEPPPRTPRRSRARDSHR